MQNVQSARGKRVGPWALTICENWGRNLESPERFSGPKSYSQNSDPLILMVFSYVVKGIKIKIPAKFRASRCLRFEDTKKIISPEKFRDFRETGPLSARSACPQL